MVLQFLLLALIFFLPAVAIGQFSSLLLGSVMKFFGWILLIWAALSLGRNLTPLPKPKTDAQLVTSGAFAWMRHPIYSALLLLSFGASLERGHGIALGLCVCLAVLLELKSRREEAWLLEQFAAYAEYRDRVKKFIPMIY